MTVNTKSAFVEGSIHALINEDGEVFGRLNNSFVQIDTTVRMKNIMRDSLAEEPLLLSTNSRVYRLHRNMTLSLVRFVENTPNITQGSYTLFSTNNSEVFSYLITPDGLISVRDKITLPPLENRNIVRTVSNSVADHFALILDDGTLWMWGENIHFQLGDGTPTRRESPVRSMVNIKDKVLGVSLGLQFTIARCENDVVYIFGSVYDGLAESTPTRLYIPGVSRIKKVSAGKNHATLVDDKGVAFALGLNRVGQLADSTFISRRSPVLCEELRKYGEMINIINYGDSSVLIYQGKIVLWNTEEGVPFTSDFVAMDMSKMKSPVKQVIGGDDFTLLLTEEGSLFASGANTFGNLGDGTMVDAFEPVPVIMSGVLYQKRVVQVATTQRDTTASAFVITNDGKLYGWGNIANYTCKSQKYLSPTPDIIDFPTRPNYTVKAIVPSFGIVILDDGQPYRCTNESRMERYAFPHQEMEEVYEIIFKFPDDNGFISVTRSSKVLIVTRNSIMAEIAPMMDFYEPIETVSVGMLTKLNEFDMKDVQRVTLWFMEGRATLIFILYDGRTFLATPAGVKQYHTVDPIRSTESILVFSNSTMLVFWDFLIPVVRTIPFPNGNTTLARLISVSRTKYGLSAIVWSCSDSFTGDNCTVPVCPSGCSGNGVCVSPLFCQCNAIFDGADCTRLSGLTLFLIIAGCFSVAALLLSILFFGTMYSGKKLVAQVRHLIKQRRTVLEMEELLREGLVKDAEHVDRDWVIPLSEITFTERLDEGSFGVVFKGRYKGSDV